MYTPVTPPFAWSLSVGLSFSFVYLVSYAVDFFSTLFPISHVFLVPEDPGLKISIFSSYDAR